MHTDRVEWYEREMTAAAERSIEAEGGQSEWAWMDAPGKRTVVRVTEPLPPRVQ